MKLLIINGPDINFPQIRENGLYGCESYEYQVQMPYKKAEEKNHLTRGSQL